MARNGDLALSREPPPVRRLMRTTYDLKNIDYGSLMLQTGYFTLRLDRDRLRYDYPNNEVRLTFASSLLEDFGRYAATDELTALHRSLAEEDYDAFCTRLHTFMAGMPGEKIAQRDRLPPDPACPVPADAGRVPVRGAPVGRPVGPGGGLPGHVCVFEFKYNQSPRSHWSRSRRATTDGATLPRVGGSWPSA